MTCPKYGRFERGRLSRDAFARHARGCRDCRAAEDQDRRWQREIPALRTPVSSPALWDRIEAALRAEAAAPAAGDVVRKAPIRPRARTRSFRLWPLLVPAAAGLLLGAILFLRPKSIPATGLLGRSMLAKVEAQEKAYLDAIGELEAFAGSRISAMDPLLMSLYRDRLAVVDAQIEKCREALDANPANAHMRRFLLAALQDKKETLAEALAPRSKDEFRRPT